MKVIEIKQKVAAKVAKGKAKVAKKCGKAKVVKKCAGAVALAAALVAVAGCQSPAQRAQTAEATQKFYVYEGATATFTFGSEFLSLAQSNETGGNDAGQTATQTTDTKPEVAVGVGGSSAGVGGTSSGASKTGVGAAIGAAVDAVGGMFTPTATDAPQAKDAAKAAKPCEGGQCEFCADGECSE